MTRMRGPRPPAALLAALLLCGCTGTVSPEQRAATDAEPSGRPYQGPVLYQGYAPGLANAFSPLSCHAGVEGTVCSR